MMEAGAVTQWIAATMAGSLYKVLPSTAGGQRPAAGGRSTAKMEATTIPDSSGEVAGPRLGEVREIGFEPTSHRSKLTLVCEIWPP
ncbi:hypothetical protein CDL15_Pgr024905 [Punica granatum]|uniref:Uncharacterized protein n=1 Tax=Punica granatum TaxID=22663 RepID=A0A218W8B6_PUNGR|nr:hypothetical protein CDL15_Pgr024905 [Punica granatum]